MAKKEPLSRENQSTMGQPLGAHVAELFFGMEPTTRGVLTDEAWIGIFTAFTFRFAVNVNPLQGAQQMREMIDRMEAEWRSSVQGGTSKFKKQSDHSAVTAEWHWPVLFRR